MPDCLINLSYRDVSRL